MSSVKVGKRTATWMGTTRTLFTAELGRVHSLAEHLDSKGASLLERAIFLVILLQQALSASVVRSGACRLPTTVVSRRVAVVELELSAGVPTRIDERYTERSETTVLGVALLEIAEPPHELFTGDVFVVREKVALGNLPCVCDEDVGIGCHSGDGADHVAAFDEDGVSHHVR